MNTTSSVLIETTGHGRLGREERLMFDYASQIGLSVHMATAKQLERGQVRIAPGAVAIGGVTFVRNALRQLGKPLPLHTPYPEILSHLLYRDVKRLATLREALTLLDAGQRLFIKPAGGWKRFTGFVAEFSDDYRFAGASRTKPVWVSSVIDLASEYRAYVHAGVVLDVRFAEQDGDPGARPDRSVVDAAVAALQAMPGIPSGYVIDFGVTPDGRTVLIEMNDGFSFGAYNNVPASVHWTVSEARWHQLVGDRT